MDRAACEAQAQAAADFGYEPTVAASLATLLRIEDLLERQNALLEAQAPPKPDPKKRAPRKRKPAPRG